MTKRKEMRHLHVFPTFICVVHPVEHDFWSSVPPCSNITCHLIVTASGKPKVQNLSTGISGNHTEWWYSSVTTLDFILGLCEFSNHFLTLYHEEAKRPGFAYSVTLSSDILPSQFLNFGIFVLKYDDGDFDFQSSGKSLDVRLRGAKTPLIHRNLVNSHQTELRKRLDESRKCSPLKYSKSSWPDLVTKYLNRFFK